MHCVLLVLVTSSISLQNACHTHGAADSVITLLHLGVQHCTPLELLIPCPYIVIRPEIAHLQLDNKVTLSQWIGTEVSAVGLETILQ